MACAAIEEACQRSKDGEEEMRVRIEKDIVIPAGLVMDDAPRITKRYMPFAEALIGFGRDHTARFTIDEDAIKSHPDQFTILE